MAVKGSLLNLADTRRGGDPNDLYARMIEMLAQDNEILQDLPMVECNKTDSHKALVRTGLPETAWRSLNQGIPSSKSAKAPIEFTCGQLTGRSTIDVDLADLGGNTAETRMSEAKSFIEAMSQEMASTLFYGNEAIDQNQFTGLARYYSSLSGAASSDNVVDFGGSGSDNTSIWLVSWGNETIHGIHPKGLVGGLSHEDKGQVRVNDDDGNPYDAYEDVFKWNCGLAVRDWRYAGRIANIDVSTLRTETDYASAKKIIKQMITLSERVKGQGVWYMSPVVRTALRHGILEKISSNLTAETVNGKRVLMFDEKPVRSTDALLLTEAAVA